MDTILFFQTQMKFAQGKVERFRVIQEKNTDPYGSAVVRYCERWANLMETHLKENPGLVIANVAEHTSYAADTEGITGAMYGIAVAILAECWAGGEELRRWHNIKTQINHEGEEANEKPGTVLNPAMLTFKTRKS